MADASASDPNDPPQPVPFYAFIDGAPALLEAGTFGAFTVGEDNEIYFYIEGNNHEPQPLIPSSYRPFFPSTRLSEVGLAIDAPNSVVRES